MIRPIEKSGFIKLTRYAQIELSQEKDVESSPTKEGRDDKGLEGVDPTDSGIHHIGGNHGDDAWQHHGGEEY